MTKIRGIRACCVAPVDKSQPINKLHDSDYQERGDHRTPLNPAPKLD
ncbi:MAG: hypothetical protein ACFB13_09605 [Kiloniellaceae bacterium]